MEFHLNETNSYDILRHYSSYQDIIKCVNSEAYDIMMRYYNEYLNGDYVKKHTNWFWKPKSSSKFFEDIAKGNSSFEVHNDIMKRVYSFNYAAFNIEKLKKYEINFEPVALEIVDESVKCPYVYSKQVNEIVEFHDILLEFGKTPYTVDMEVLKKFKQVKKENEKRIELLKLVGVNFEL